MRKLVFLLLLSSITFGGFAQKKAKTNAHITKQTPSALTVKANELVTSLSTADFDHAWSLYDANIKKILGVAEITKMWKDIELRNGEFTNIVKTSSETLNAQEIVYVLCLFKKGKVKFKITLNADKEITSFLILKESQK